MQWISRWKETPLVIGVKENVPPVCHEVRCGQHSTNLTLLSVKLTGPFTASLLFFFFLYVSMYSFP